MKAVKSCKTRLNAMELSGERTPKDLFFDACVFGNEAKMSAAMAQGVDVNTKDGANQTGLYLAMANENDNIVDILLAHPNIDINGITVHGSPLFVAARDDLSSAVIKLGKMPSLRGDYLDQIQ